MITFRRAFPLLLASSALALVFGQVVPMALRRIGKQLDGTTLLSSGQTIPSESYSFPGRPADMAIRPQGDVFAMMVMSQVDGFVPSQILLANSEGLISKSGTTMKHHPSFHGMVWTPDGSRLVCSTGERYEEPNRDGLEVFRYEDGKLVFEREVVLGAKGEPDRVVPGGLCFSKDGQSIFVACADLNAVLELDANTFERKRRIEVSMLPYGTYLSEDGNKLLVTNWGGRRPLPTDRIAKTGISKVVVNRAGSSGSGTVSIVELTTGAVTEIEVGMHPSAAVIRGIDAYVANTMSDSISRIDLTKAKLIESYPLKWNGQKLLGSMPNGLALAGDTLLICNGGDNAVAEFSLSQKQILGYRPTGYFPIAVADLGKDRVVLNSKGNGSVARTRYGKPGNAHDFEGTVSILKKDELVADTARVAKNNNWGYQPKYDKMPVFNGAIQHVVYIIKENKTYDQIFGDMPEGNGDPNLCILGETIMPNHRALAREFSLFDNAYVSGTNSGDGHQWSTQAIANDYVEKFYVGYSRTYGDDGNCAMSISNYGTLWETAAAKKKSVRVYGEFVVAEDATFTPRPPKDWFEAWEDRRLAKHQFKFVPHARVESIKPYIHPSVHYWPLIQSDQSRADEFIKDLTNRIENRTVPNLMILSLPCDHTEGEDPNYPQPKSMMADNDLALGRIVDAVSHSSIWKNTCIFVIEDDAQSGLDHVDGHRTPYLVISPYTKRKSVDHSFQTTVSMIRTIEMMLGLEPLNRMDALSEPILNFTETADLTPYDVRPNNVPLDLANPGRKPSASAEDKLWAQKTKALDWSHPDGPDAGALDEIIWHSLKTGRPFPAAARTKTSTKDED